MPSYIRFDLGSGTGIIKGSKPLELNQWHKIKLERNRRNGSMIINDKEILNTLVTGKFQGLDLATPLYLGGHPKVSDLGYGQGFIGCVSQLRINGDDIDITPKNDALGMFQKLWLF